MKLGHAAGAQLPFRQEVHHEFGQARLTDAPEAIDDNHLLILDQQSLKDSVELFFAVLQISLLVWNFLGQVVVRQADQVACFDFSNGVAFVVIKHHL